MNTLADKAKAVAANQQAMLLFVLLAMVAFFTWQNPIFFSNAVFGNIISDWSPIVLIAVGQAFVIISGGIDLSVGSTVAISGVVSALAIRSMTEDGHSATVVLILGFLISAAIGLLVGAINAFLIPRRRWFPSSQPS